MVRNRFGLWLGLAVATMVGVGVAAFFLLKHERAQDELNEVNRLVERSQDLVRRIESELGSRAVPQSDSARA